MRAMQFDTTNLRAAEVLPALTRMLAGSPSDPDRPSGPAAQRLLDLLDGWNQRMSTDSIAATVFGAFFEQWHARVLQAGFPAEVSKILHPLGPGSGLALRLLTEGKPAGWFGTGVDLAGVVAETAAATLDDLAARFGADPAGWRWGAVHQVSFRHPLDGRPGTEGLFATAPREAHGGNHVLNNNGFSHTRPFDVGAGPEYRLVVDMGDLDGATTVLTTGESGLPGSPHYDDMVDPWVTGSYLPLPFSPGAVDAAKAGETRLEPSR
jgi:penicillin amidase